MERLWEAFAGPAEAGAILDSRALARLAAQASSTAEAAGPAETRPLATAGSDRAARVTFGGLESAGGGSANPRAGDVAAATGFTVYFTDDFATGLVVDESTRRLLEGGPADQRALGLGRDDVLELAGDFSEGFALPGATFGIDRIVLHGDGDYFLTAGEGTVAAGATLTVDGLAATTTIGFDGSGESDGRFDIRGGSGDDLLVAGGGDDRLFGGLGADVLGGGGGRDVFVYTHAAESTGAGHDLLAGFDPAEDRIDLPVAVSGFAATVESGEVSAAGFDADLSAILDPTRLGAGEAVWFTPDEGDFAGTIFLVIDGNGEAGYQPGEDFVIAVAGPGPDDLSTDPGLFV